MNYYSVTIFPKEPLTESYAEIISAWLSDAGFESFTEDEKSISAFIPEAGFNNKLVTDLLEWINQQTAIEWNMELIQEKNWNEEWEKNYEPVIISGKCIVRAPFHHPVPSIEFDIEIMPKMSFGTAHHETTRMMIEFILNHNWSDKKVLDMGSGTGVLAILVSKMGADSVLAVDNDKWAYENALENISRNQLKNVQVMQGNQKLIAGKFFDVILANINRNVLLEHTPAYLQSLRPGGRIYMSGFYEEDIPVIMAELERNNLHLLSKKQLNKWVALAVG